MTRHGKHKMLDLTCPCGAAFQRQKRRVATNKTQRCPKCLITNKPPIWRWNTKMLKEVIQLDGLTNAGTDYEERLDDIKEELYRREEREREKYIKEQTA